MSGELEISPCLDMISERTEFWGALVAAWPDDGVAVRVTVTRQRATTSQTSRPALKRPLHSSDAMLLTPRPSVGKCEMLRIWVRDLRCLFIVVVQSRGRERGVSLSLRAANTSSTFDRRKRGDSASPLSRAPKGKSGTRDGAERRKEGAGACERRRCQ